MKKGISLFILVLLIIIASLGTMAPTTYPTPTPTPTPTPPPVTHECSPGFWKNHLDAWPTSLQNAEWEDTGMTWLEALQGGKNTRFTRHAVAAELNSMFPSTVCD